jgi:hypothetical protein
MTLAITGNCQRHLRISFFLLMWMCSYIQMIDQLRLDLSDLSCITKNNQHTNDTTNHLTTMKSDRHEKVHNLVNPFL